MVKARSRSDDETGWETFNLLKRGGAARVPTNIDDIPTLKPPLLPPKRVAYLKKEIKPFIKRDNRVLWGQELGRLTAPVAGDESDSEAASSDSDSSSDSVASVPAIVTVLLRDGTVLKVEEPPSVAHPNLECDAEDCICDDPDVPVTGCDWCPVTMHDTCMDHTTSDPGKSDDVYWACSVCLNTVRLGQLALQATNTGQTSARASASASSSARSTRTARKRGASAAGPARATRRPRRL